ncbi:MAG: sensor signal transduction histidine kinase [Myxococcaceae bacterium]|nr:sensor signal transduction histidine kinase [Myxococcaceae bacterium]
MSFEPLEKQELALESTRRALVDSQSAVQEKERLLHELQVHQIELESQNRSLREMQSTLEESRTRYAELYDFAPVAYFTLDQKGCILEVNLTGASMVGRDRAQLIGMPFVSLVRVEDPGNFWAHLRRCASTRSSVVSELALGLTRAGRIHVQAVSTPVIDSAGVAIAFRTAFTDISDRKQAVALEKEARQAEQRLRAQIEAVDRAALAVTRALATADNTTEHVLISIIQQAAQLTGAEFAAVGIDEVVTAYPRRPGIEGVLAALALDGQSLRIRDVRAHPSFAGFPASHPRITSVILVPIIYGEVTLGSLLVANKQGAAEFSEHDQHSLEMLSERIGFALEIARLNAKQTMEHERLHLLADTGRALAATLDLSLTLEMIARLAIPRFADFTMTFLYEHNELKSVSAAHRNNAIERQVAELRTFKPDPHSWITEILKSRQAALVPKLGISNIRDPFVFKLADTLGLDSFIGVPVISRDRVLGVMLFAAAGANRQYDSMDLAMAEEIAYRTALAVDNANLYEVAQSAIRSRDNLMAIVSHDLRNPLNAIFVNLGLLLRSGGAGERRKGHRQLELIKLSSDHLNRLVEDLLTASTIDAGCFTANRRPEAVSVLFEDLVSGFEPLAHERGLTLETSPAPEVLKVECDRDRMFQVFGNLVANAIKVTPRGGKIRVSAEADGAFVRFSVSDSGPGIAAENIPFLFDRYWKDDTSGKRGTGLGLYIVKGIVETHGGKVWVESQEGATFWFTLPVAP